MDVSLEDAYAEAQKIIGEQVLTIRFLQREIERLTADES